MENCYQCLGLAREGLQATVPSETDLLALALNPSRCPPERTAAGAAQRLPLSVESAQPVRLPVAHDPLR